MIRPNRALRPLVLLVVVSVAACGPTATDDSPAYLLAIADTGISEPDEELVADYQTALDAMADSCVEDQDTSHGDYALTVKDLLAAEGITMSALVVLESMSETASSMKAERISCAEAYALFTSLVVTGS